MNINVITASIRIISFSMVYGWLMKSTQLPRHSALIFNLGRPIHSVTFESDQRNGERIYLVSNNTLTDEARSMFGERVSFINNTFMVRNPNILNYGRYTLEADVDQTEYFTRHYFRFYK